MSKLLKKKLTVLLSGMIAGVPHQGGATWAVLQYLLGFRRLGHDVYFAEPVQRSALRPEGGPLQRTANAAYFQSVAADFGLEQNAALLLAGTRETVGLSYEDLHRAAGRTDLLVNIAGMLDDRTLTDRIPLRVYLDIDPAFTQLWHDVEKINMRFEGHNYFMTIGQNIGESGCGVPTCGLTWHKTLQPVVMEHWPRGERITYDALTTVANWRGYGSVEYEGVFYGQKAHSWRSFIELPALTGESFMPALAIHHEEQRDLAELARRGWRLLDPSRVAGTPAAYRQFIRESKGEFGLAKSGYAASSCGWFSDRSACYLTAGRPVVAQETGFSRFLPTGEGLLSFQTTEEAAECIRELNSDYYRHSRASRAIAAEHFDSDKVLPRFLQSIGMVS